MITIRDGKGRISTGSGKKHGYSSSSMYDCWVAMKARCCNTQHPCYKHYGGRGITVCPTWINSFDCFLKDMGNKPEGMSLDRIDVNGDYTKENCRWLSIQQQQLNRTNNSKHPGIYYEPTRGRWRAEITYKNTKHFLGRYKDKNEALAVRRAAEERYWDEV